MAAPSLGAARTTVVFVFVVVSVFLEALASGEMDLLAEVTGREELVNWAGYGEEKLSTVEIGGRILCHGDAASVHPYPVSGATVAVLCGANRRTKKKTWGKGSTDASGSFLIDLPSHLHAVPNLEKICCVKVVHLPGTSACRHAAGAGRHKGIRLSSVGEGVRTYSAHNIHLMPRKNA